MLDAIAQTLAAQAAKPAPSANVNTHAAPIASQQAVPILKSTVSAPESIPPVSLPQAAPNASAPPTAANGTSHLTSTKTSTAKNVQPSSGGMNQAARIDQAVDADGSQTLAQASVDQWLWLQQRLADIVAREKPLKDAKLRAKLEAMAIAFAQAGQFAQARQTSQAAMLSPEAQANLLAQIDAIAAKPLQPNQPALNAEAWMPATLGRSSVPQYVTYSLNGFGGAIGGIGIVIESDTPAFNGQNGMPYAAVNRFNATLWNGLSFIFPLAVPAPITSGFGWRGHPIGGDRRFHSGTDIGAPMGTPVLATAAGKVALADQLNGYGLTIILSHQNNTRETLYGHLSELLVKPGQAVEKGTVIGRVGSTGLSTGPHLHFELRQKTPSGWQAIDPGAQLEYALARLIKVRQAG